MATDTKPWRKQLNVGDGMYQHRCALTDVFRLYTTIWSDRLGHVKDFTCHIDLHPGSRPIRQHPYRTGPDEREIERDAISEMPKTGR